MRRRRLTELVAAVTETEDAVRNGVLRPVVDPRIRPG